MMNLIKLYTIHGAMHVDADQLNNGRTILRIYTARGNRLADVARTEMERERARYGVHRENLYASPALAEAAYRRMIADMAARDSRAAA